MNKKKQVLKVYNIVVIALLLLGAVYVCSRFIHLGSLEYTDNAMVHRNLVPVNTRVQGFIKEIRFKEFQYVHQGDTLAIIEDAEYRLALAQAEAGVKGSRAGSGAVSASMNTTQNNVAVAGAGMQVATAEINEAKVGMENAKHDYDRYAALLKKGAVTQQQFENVKTQYEQATSRYEGAHARFVQASASRKATAVVKNEQRQRLGQSSAGVSVAQATLNLARLNLSYTVIIAPCDGYMGRKIIHEGQLVQPGQMLAEMVDQREVWIVANYRESQMKNIKVGAPVEITADAVPNVTFKGKVQSISSATGSAYSNIPVDNATGNFVKVEQRVPVLIELTKDNQLVDVKRLLDGLNVECEVDY
jgi:membrane fusion protein (multidrug efflux system)